MAKVVALIDMPDRCGKCIFHACKYYLPFSTGRKGYYCRLDKEKEVFDLDYEDTTFKSKKCPLRKLPEKGLAAYKTEYLNAYQDGWNACLEVITGGAGDE